ncbi:hypothetical protein TL16_g08543 [Triparma laevis f. inornata]|uniref:ABC1 atypical kinase-like domain-containing protein n=1 Tax=Triparma laevis f. inornata TaxID=1714386 RepID=A0A9W7EKK5_9STRA|nr:hypothetical protein TL16_g08543 [Triparma laevis f. inornata]
MLRNIAKVTSSGALAATFGGYFYAKSAMGDDALDRMIKFEKVGVPMTIDYKWEEAKCEKLPKILPTFFSPVGEEEETKRFEALHKKWAKPLFDVYMELGGFYYKNGQKIAANMSGVVPKTYIDMYQPFLNDIPERTSEDIRNVVETQLGLKREEVFSGWEDKPIGCASIGQVHRATLKSTGKRVVVKVQNPDAERTFKGDVFAINMLVEAAMPQFAPAFNEIQKQFATEFDYRGEMKNAIEIRENLKRGGFKDVIVPEVYPDLCTEKLMVMEEIYPSIPLHHALEEQAEKLAKQKGMSKKEFLDTEKERLEEEIKRLAKEGKVMESVSSKDYDRYIALQSLKQSTSRLSKGLYNWTLGFFLPTYDLSEDSVVVPINAAKLVDDLLEVHGHEVLIDGCFNADPHPGNILYVDGKLALIDYGQVKRIDDKARLDIAKMIVLVDEAIKVDPRTNPNVPPEVHAKAKKSIANFAKEIGMETEHMLDESFYEMCVVYFGRMDATFIYPKNILQWTDSMQEKDPLGNIDKVDYLVMLHTSSMMLRGARRDAAAVQEFGCLVGTPCKKGVEGEGITGGRGKGSGGWGGEKS